METLSTLVRSSLPNYLRGLPIPDSITGFAQLTAKDWLSLVPFVGSVSFIVYVTVQAFHPTRRPAEESHPVNLEIQKDSAKVVNAVDIEDIGNKAVYCRCWRSKKFPLCDGSHNKHNEETGDNVGPLIVKRKEPTQ